MDLQNFAHLHWDLKNFELNNAHLQFLGMLLHVIMNYSKSGLPSHRDFLHLPVGTYALLQESFGKKHEP